MIFHVGLTDPNTIVAVEADTMATIADMLVFINGSEYAEGMSRVAAFPTDRVLFAAAETSLTDFRIVGGNTSLVVPPLQSAEQRRRDRELLSYAPAIAHPHTHARQTGEIFSFNTRLAPIDEEDAPEIPTISTIASAPVAVAVTEDRVVFHDEVLPTVQHMAIEAFDPSATNQGAAQVLSGLGRSTSRPMAFSGAGLRPEYTF